MAKTEISKAYEPQKVEDSIYKRWESSGLFKPNMKADGKCFSISLPPPNATGTLHIGHAAMLAIILPLAPFGRSCTSPSVKV
jgi:valyl-tRNA synthetase